MTGSKGSHPAFPLLRETLRPNKDGSPWYLRVFRITTVRIVSQAFFFSLFVFLLWVTWFSRLGGYPVSLFLEVDPLVSFATALSTQTIYRNLWRAMFVLVPTLLLGRVFCNWMCPYGTLHQFIGWIFNIRKNKDNIHANRYRSFFRLKYVILGMFLILAAFGSLQIGLIDPICLLVRTFTVTVMPAADLTASVLGDAISRAGISTPVSFLSSAPGSPEQRIFAGAWFVGVVILGLVGMNLVIPRFFCRVLCPLGAFLGVISRFSLWRIDRDLTKCTDCDLCLKHCEGAADPQAALRKSECFVCFNCIDDCPEGALSFRLSPPSWKDRIVGEKDRILGRIKEGTATIFGRPVISKVHDTELKGPGLPRRRWVLTGVAGVLAYPFLRLSAAVNKRGFHEKAIRPPGSVEESEFLERCIKCDQCINVCPTNVLQPSSLAQGGLEGLWTPVMDFSIGFCQYNCTLCSEVCPTGAIQKISLATKLGVADPADATKAEPGQPAESPAGPSPAGPIKVGTAFFDRGRCLPWAMETPCVVCEEVCPVSPKAIGTYDEEITRWDGTKVVLNRPYMRPELCIGCGICEHECPVIDSAAVYVTAIGETRSEERSLLLNKNQPPAEPA
ncbi:MAG: 4Fe-4S dicluster domain-containing protein [Gemmatimonadetes bacterium]|nr:4Fe-4S dicluster domain-containing protein [Gemmatimonadota bacterium]